MAGELNKIDSNVSGLRYAEEECIGKLQEEAPAGPGTSVWIPLEPNSYADFGGDNKLEPRDPINENRQRKKGVIVDEDAAGGFNQDLTQTNAQDLLQGFFYADARKKDEFGGDGEITNVDGTTEDYDAASGLDAFQAGDLVFASGFADIANNGLKRVTAAAGTALTVAEDLVDEAAPPAAAKLVTVGFQGAAGDIDVDAAGALPVLTSTILDFTTLGLIPGETIFIGGDGAAFGFANAENNGFKRVRSITVNTLTIDKSASTMITEGSTTETVQIFLGRVLKNELVPLIKRRTYNLERTLGAPDPLLPSEIQSEYLEGSVPGEFTLNSPTAEKLTVDMTFLSTKHTTRSGATGVKAGTRPTLVEADAFNTTNDFARTKISIVTPGDEAPTPLVGFFTALTLTINNNLAANKAVGVSGAFDVTAGNFQVSGSIDAYFTDVSAVTAVKNNSDVTLEFVLVKDSKGISIDVPLIALGDARLNVEKDTPIKMPLTIDAASAAIIDQSLNHTLMMVFYDFLPDAA